MAKKIPVLIDAGLLLAAFIILFAVGYGKLCWPALLIYVALRRSIEREIEDKIEELKEWMRIEKYESGIEP